MAVWIDTENSDFWIEVCKGVERALSKEGIQLEVLVTGDQERSEIIRWINQNREDLRGLGIASNDSAAELINAAMSEGVPVLCMGYDVKASKRVGAIATYYYECGRKAGNDFASLLGSGVVAVVSEHPVHRAQDEFWEGFRHGLLKNKRLRTRWFAVTKASDARTLCRRALEVRGLKGIFLFGAQPMEAWLRLSVSTELRKGLRVGGFSYLQGHRLMKQEQVVDWLILENPEDLGFRAGRLLYDLAFGRKIKSQLYLPVEVLK